MSTQFLTSSVDSVGPSFGIDTRHLRYSMPGQQQHKKKINTRYALGAINEKASMPAMKDVRPPRGLRFKRSESVPISQFSRLLVVDSLSEGEEEDDVYSFASSDSDDSDDEDQEPELQEVDETKEDETKHEYRVHTTSNGDRTKREIRCSTPKQKQTNAPLNLHRSRSDSALSRMRVRFSMCSVLRLPSTMRGQRQVPSVSLAL